jgi:transcriptional regulator with XRE-family HTH domain
LSRKPLTSNFGGQERFAQHPAHRVPQELLIELRKAAGFTQVQFTKRLGWQKSVVERIAAGHQIPTHLETRDWAIAAGITPYAFTWRHEARMKRLP